MGAVPMKVDGSFSIHGDVCLTYAVYIYCDNCGSFNIQKVLSLRQWGLIIGSCSIIAAVGYLLFVATAHALGTVDWAILLCVGALVGIIVYGLWGFPAYRCRKCGEFTTFRYNTREYPSDVSIVDVQDQLVQKYGLTGWPEDQPIEAYLSPPEKTKGKT